MLISLSIFKIYSAADVLVLPSLAEGFGLPIVEAMTCGCPVITSNYGAMKEVAGDAALLVDPKSVEKISEAIEKVLSYTEKERDKMIVAGYERAKKFTWENYAKKTLNVYKKVFKHDNKPSL